jgi:phosphoesterase RecJ-like protein
MAENLYVAILTDTGRFTFANSTPESLRAAAELVSLGASPEVIGRKLYESLSLAQLKMRARVLAALAKSPDGKIAWTALTQKDFQDLSIGPEDTQEFSDIPRSLAGVEVGVLFRELGQGQIKVSLRSKGNVDVNEVARKFGGGGHSEAAGCILEGTLSEIQKKLIAAIQEAIK